MKKFVIERDIPKVGSLEREQLRDAAKTTNAALRQLGPDIQWVESYVAGDKTFCIYLAKDEAIIQEHARISGFPATKVSIMPTGQSRQIAGSTCTVHRVKASYAYSEMEGPRR